MDGFCLFSSAPEITEQRRAPGGSWSSSHYDYLCSSPRQPGGSSIHRLWTDGLLSLGVKSGAR